METTERSSDDVRMELSRLRKDLDVQKELAALRMEVTLQLSYFKWAAWTVGACLAVLGFLGVKAWTDLTGSAQKLYEKQLGEMQERYSNLSRGFSLVDSGRTQQAMPYLTPLYEANRYDDPVVRALLYALHDLNDCQEGLRRVKELRQDEARFLRFKDPHIFNFAGIFLRDCSSDNRQALEEARQLFELILKRQSADDPERRFGLYSLFTYHAILGNLQAAESYLQNASSIQEDYPPMDGMRTDPWFKALRQRDDSLAKKLESLWSRVMKQRKGKT